MRELTPHLQSTKQKRVATLLTIAQLGYAHWFFGNVYESVVRVPDLIAKSEAKWGERYLNEVLAALARFQNPSSPPALDIRNLAIACHSGGGVGMRNLIGTLGKYQPKLKECWGFDCLYGADDATSVHDRGTALLVFLILGLVEEAAVGQTGWFNHRIVAVCAAGLLAGPGVGAVVAAFMTWIAVTFHGRPLVICGVEMFSGGLIGGWLYRLRPKLAQHPLLGFCLTLAVSLLRDGLVFFYVPGALAGTQIGSLLLEPL